MPKFQITNTSASSEKGARAIYLVEAGRAIKPGESALANRLEPGTRKMEEAKLIKIEEGNFARAPMLSANEERRLGEATESSTSTRKVHEVDIDAIKAQRAAEKEARRAAAAPMVPLPQEERGSEPPAGESGGEGEAEPFSDEALKDESGSSKSKSGSGKGKGKG